MKSIRTNQSKIIIRLVKLGNNEKESIDLSHIFERFLTQGDWVGYVHSVLINNIKN